MLLGGNFTLLCLLWKTSRGKEKVVVERKKLPSFVVADNLNQPSDEVPLHVENPLSDKVDVILPSNEVTDSPASNEIDENFLSIIVAAKQSLNEFYENIPSNIVADNKSRNELDRNILSNVVIGNQAANVVEKLPSKEVDEKQSINEGAVEKNTDLEDSLQVELSNFLDLGSCQDFETLDISGFNFKIELGTETSSHQEEREIEIGPSQSPGDADSMTTSSSPEEHELENDHSISCQNNYSSLNNKPKRPLLEK